MERALELIGATEDVPVLDALAAAVGYAPHHFHRLFKRATGVTPAAYGRNLRAGRLQTALDESRHVTDAIYSAGYNTPSRAYADASQRLGMTPSAWKNGGKDVVIRWTLARSSLGSMLIAATDKGLCRISFDEDEAELHRRFPNADVRPADPAFVELAGRVVALLDQDRPADDLPVDVQGTVFQEAVWEALRTIPPGETRSYAQIAAAVGRPGAVRAVGSACGGNQLAVLIPCHRVVRGDGRLGGYAYGRERKEALLRKERQTNNPATPVIPDI